MPIFMRLAVVHALSLAAFVCPAAFAGTLAGPGLSGTLLVMPASASITRQNDEAYLTLTIEEQDADKVAAASRVNAGMTHGTALVRQQDATAVLTTHGYYTYPVYPDARPGEPRAVQPAGWRVGESLEVRTRNLGALPKVVAAAQGVLAVSGLRFGLSAAAARKLDAELVAASYANLGERIAAAAQAMGCRTSDAALESVEYQGTGGYIPETPRAVAMFQSKARGPAVVEPSFEPGETTVTMSVVGKVRFR